ncbi:MAG: DNA repair protein RadC [Alistipes sp.]|nr:DNA repair protein RadC [Alistipes sp.]
MNLISNKLLTRGSGALNDAELLSLLLDDGKTPEAAEEMARKILEECKSLAGIVRTDIARLRMVEGMGLKRAVRVAAAAEIGRRIMESEAEEVHFISTSSDVTRLFRPMFGAMKHEECWALYLTSSNKIIERQRISQGGVQGTVVDNRLITKRALELLASQMILVHNHPSGSPEPSEQDKTTTKRLNDALSLFDIRLLDHIIIAASGKEFSFHQAGLL